MQINKYTGNQQNQLQNVLGMAMGGLQQGKMPGGISFEPIAQQAMTNFNQNIIPSIAERFTAMGGGQRSSAFQGALGGAGAGLAENLASMKSQYNMQLLPILMQMLQMGTTPQYENMYLPGQQGILQSGLESLLHGAGAAAGGALTGGGWGALMSGIQGLFGKKQPGQLPQYGAQPQYFGGGISSGLPSDYLQNRGAFNHT
jgi:hypothetical protein